MPPLSLVKPKREAVPAVRLFWVGDRVRVVSGPWRRPNLPSLVGIVHRLDPKNLAVATCRLPSGLLVAVHVEDLEMAEKLERSP